MAKILIAEDDTSINTLIAANLRLVGHTPLQVYDGVEAVQAVRSRQPDLLLLDVMMPGLDGFSVMEKVRGEVPIIFLTARTGLEDRLQGLSGGAEDYIIKPFEILEVLARVENVLRRTKKHQNEFRLKDVRVDLDGHRVFLQEEEVTLTPQEYALLEMLIINRNLALSREQILETAWGYDYEGDTRTVDVHIQRVRKKLNLEQEIQTVYKVGYRLQTGGK